MTQLAEAINRALVDHLPPRIRVVGEVSNLTIRNHWYFSLKDEESVVSCVAWASKARRFGFTPEHGMQVIASGSVQFYGPQGRCQVYVDSLTPVGAGPLELRFRALCEELRGLGYFDDGRKKTPPLFPRNVAVITSATGAALQDVLDTMRRRCPCIGVYIVDVRVQGLQAAPEIVRALKLVERLHHRRNIDAVILTRGGGSLEDLWAFNERDVADALLNYPVPTLAAIGHETDTTVAELVADLRCATPTQAAMRVTPDRLELMTQLDQSQRRLATRVNHELRYRRQGLDALKARLGSPGALLDRADHRLDLACRRIIHALVSRVERSRSRLDRAGTGLERVRPHRVTAAREQALAIMADRLDRAVQHRRRHERERLDLASLDLDNVRRRRLRNDRTRLDSIEAVLKGLDPRSVVHRGYSITRGADGGIIRSKQQVQTGERLNTHVSDGVIESDVIKSREPRPVAPARPSRRSRPRREPPGQMDLFSRDR